MNIDENNNKISGLINLQNNLYIISRYDYNGNTHIHHVDSMYVHKFTRLFIDRLDINFMDIQFHLISSELWRSGYYYGLVIWRPSGVGGSNPNVDKVFCNVNLFCVPRSWTGRKEIKHDIHAR